MSNQAINPDLLGRDDRDVYVWFVDVGERVLRFEEHAPCVYGQHRSKKEKCFKWM